MNVLLNKPSSSYALYGDFVASRANDGVTSGENINNLFITNYSVLPNKPWWTGDFGSEKRIKKVVVYPRTDSNP